MPANLVKRCPTCGAENAPTAARCACGAFLLGVDLTERAPAPAEPVTIPEAEAPDATASGAASSNTPAPAMASAKRAEMPSAPAQDGDSADATQAYTAMTNAAANATAPNAAAAASPDPVAAPDVCSHADCGQPNPPGFAICVYCNRPLQSASIEERIPQPTPQPLARSTLIRLPGKLDARFTIEEPLKAAGSEADLYVVRDKASGARAVLKLYRHGIEPDTEVLERVSRAAPEQLVHLIEHGREEGIPYELLEYCEHGSLRTLLKGRPLPLEAARTLLVELADAIAHLHECGIVHRDLKPENVLIRGLLPLDLVLTDFGIASVAQATMHHTTGARTLRYSAPEVGSNWVGKPTDYWALGMMLVEALTGRHPFEGLSDAVIAHWLATRPIDVSGVTDPRWQQLCRGLLTRDPKARWGADEIARWLAGDATLQVADERAPSPPGALTPYRVGDQSCRTPRELAVALAANWAAGVKDLKRGMLRAWLQNELRDHNLARAAADAEEALEISDDERLLRLLLALDPQLPPVFKGYDVTIPGLAALTRKALEDHNEERQAVLELLDRRILERFPGNAVQDVPARFEEAKREFEQALQTAFAAGAPRDLAPEGRDWQLRMLLFVLEPPKGLVENLRASARRVGGRAAQRCAWYRALGDPADAGPAKLAAMVLLGPPAAQQGMEIERESVRRTLAALSMTIDSNERLTEMHGEARDHLAADIEASQEEDEVLGLAARADALAQAVERSLAASWRETVFETRPVTDAARLVEVRRRIGEWARWRAGDAWGGFGDAIELVAVSERRSYRLRISTQIETRRVPYKYGAVDIARMAEGAKATLRDVWTCAMPALPQFAQDLKLTEGRDLRCPGCGARGRVELQESWGATAYPFSTTFSCHDKVGVQCQTRLAWANENLPPAGIPAFVTDFVEAHARQDDLPGHAFEIMAPRIPPEWLARVPYESARRLFAEKLDGVAKDVKPHERIAAQRLRVGWTGIVEVRYRYRDKDYVLWIPERIDALPIALEHPLPSAADAPAQAVDRAEGEAPAEPSPERTAQEVQARSLRERRGLPSALRTLLVWGGVLILAACLAMWMVNWKP